ncbi:MAG: hypothetical protein KJ626_01815 [Verrucomicrobia bacterium]|nr:hypothetical protein [Verrucomicrobiota bacterium]
MLRGDGVFVPRWVVVVLVTAAILWFGFKIYLPPSVRVQRLDSPDGEKTAELLRRQHTRDHFVVMVREGFLLQTMYYSPAITNDYTVDLQERLEWTQDSEKLLFRMQGRYLWGYDFTRGRNLTYVEMDNVILDSKTGRKYAD